MYQTLLAKLARTLDQAEIPYMVIGGQAVLIHGEPRLTRDIDITLGVDSSHLKNVLAAISAVSLIPAVKDVELFVRKTNVLPITDTESNIRVDLIFSFTPYESEAIRRAVSVVFDDAPVRFASAEDLIIHKLVAGRPRDLEDVTGILARKPSLDEAYLIQWLGAFRNVVQRDLVSEFKTMKKSHGTS
jgi:hypothetical protein